MAAPGTVTARFKVAYTGFSAEAKQAFQAAVDVWAVTLRSPVPIKVEATWESLDQGVLGQAGPETFQRDISAAPHAGTWYPIALASKLANADLSPERPDITAQFNSAFGNWYYGIDAQTPHDQYDLMSVVLHEIGHGLGFIGSMRVAGGRGSWGWEGYPVIYDRFAENAAGESLLDTTAFPNPSKELAGQLQSARLFFRGPHARAANGHNPVRLYAPIDWAGGSSFSHLNESTFPSGDPNSLMTPQIGMAEAIHAPGPVGYGVLADLGW